MLTPKAILGAFFLVLAILLVASASNRLLDAFGIANAEGLTVEQRKENAREHWYEWDHRQFKQ